MRNELQLKKSCIEPKCSSSIMVPRKLSKSFRSLTQVFCPTSHHLTLIKGKTNKQNKTSTLGVIKQTFPTSSSSSLCHHFLNEKFHRKGKNPWTTFKYPWTWTYNHFILTLVNFILLRLIPTSKVSFYYSNYDYKFSWLCSKIRFFFYALHVGCMYDA
jgi:hypothetical protein